MNQELIMHASMLEKQMQETQQSLELIERELAELQLFHKNLDFLEASKEKDMLSSLGKGIFLKTQLEDKKLFVDVGAGILVRKSADETKVIVESQIQKLLGARTHFIGRLEAFQQEFQRIFIELENQQRPEKENNSK